MLVCGIVSALLYGAMIGAIGFPGYSPISQTVSELSAIDAPTRPLWMVLGAVYDVLVVAFGVGVWVSAGGKLALRVVGGLLIAHGLIGFGWPPMHQRAVLAAGGGTLTDTMHIIWSMMTVLLMLLAISFGAAAFGKMFRLYSIATVVVLIAFGALTGSNGPRVLANLPTPWVGVWERINIGVFLLWVVVLAIALFRVGDKRVVRVKRMAASMPDGIQGHVSRGFDAVREVFAENFVRRGELGGACCAFQRGEKIVDLWGGIRSKQTGEPWEQDTMVVVHSATKGLAAMTLAIAHSRGWLDYEQPVSAYWPEFAQNGKQRITVRQLLAHQAGLFAFGEPVDRTLIVDLDHLAAVLARQKPAWEPGTRQAYHALSLGFYEGELLRRVDPQHRSLGQFFQDEIASRLGEDVYIRMPETIPNSRLATLAPPNLGEMLCGFGLRFMLEVMNPHSNINRALNRNPGTRIYQDAEHIYARNLEVPSGNGVGTARAIAHAYSVFANGGRELGLRQQTLDLLAAPAISPTRGFYDECLKADGVQFSLGFMKPGTVWRFGSASSFGSPGSGGSLGFADPTVGVGYAYVTSQMGTRLTGDPRDVALREALYSAIRTWSGTGENESHSNEARGSPRAGIRSEKQFQP